MNIRPISEWKLYKHRFLFAYSGLGVLVLLLLLLYPNQIPPGLSQHEQQSVVTSHALRFTQLPSAGQVIDLPYHALQKISVQFLGLTPYGVRLPSLILAAITALCLSLIVKRWFKANVAVLSTLIMVTSAWYLAIAHLGTPAIMVPFWTSALMLCATYVSQQTKRWHIWKALFGLSAALSLYTPYMIYLFAATLLAAISQPHLRYLIRQSSKVGLTIGVFFFAVLLTPLGWGIYKDPGLLRDILAIPANLPDPLQFGKDLLQALSNVGNPFNVGGGEMVTPLMSLAVLLIAVIGAFRLLSDFHSVRSYVLLIWLAILVPIIGCNPTNLTVLFVPAFLVTAIGMNAIVRYWYRLFPINPYARIFGLIPLAILLFSIIQLNYQRYTYSMLYSPQAGQTFNSDAFLAQAEANKLPANKPLTIVVAPDNQQLYVPIAERRPGTEIVTAKQPSANTSGELLVAESQWPQLSAALVQPPSSLIVNDHKDDSLRFRIFQR